MDIMLMKLHNSLKNMALPSLVLWSLGVAAVQAGVANVQTSQVEAAEVQVSALNYVEAKTALQFDKYLASAGGKLNTFAHSRKLVGIDNRSSKRLNRDTLYSVAIVDISQGASIRLPEAGDRYISVQVVNQDGFTNKVFHGAGRRDLTLAEFDTPYVWLLVRTRVLESIPGDLQAAQALQDQMSISSASEIPYTHSNYDPVSMGATTALLLELGKGISDNSKAAGTKEQVNPVKQLLLSAFGFGTLPETESLLLTVQPNLPIHKGYVLNVKDVPVDGFWSLAMYNKEGYFNENNYDSYGFGDRTAKKNADGSITLHFGGAPSSINYIPITEGWNYVVRMYRPRAELLEGTWTFPTFEAIE
ncbi:DUF1214 domain-containing protein [Porticoccaceae bacterium]|nr:DUF1214 domain-containing protein [Porticoccaceae bacterium]